MVEIQNHTLLSANGLNKAGTATSLFLFSEWLCKSEIALPLLSRKVKKSEKLVNSAP